MTTLEPYETGFRAQSCNCWNSIRMQWHVAHAETIISCDAVSTAILPTQISRLNPTQLSTMNANSSISPERLTQLAWGYAPVLIIEAAVQHGLFDRLNHGPRTLAQLVTDTIASNRGLRAILNALVGLQLLARDGDYFALTAESSAFLVSTKTEYRGQFFRHHAQQLLPQWLKLNEVVHTGRPVATTNREDGGAEHFASFVESLFPGSFPAANALGQHLGIAQSAAPVSVLDIGAGSGVWGIALAKQSLQVCIRAVDWPRVLEVTQRVAMRHGVADRLTTVGGDLFAADFGRGHQIAVLGHILHSESRERSRQLLQKIHDALAPGGTLAIQEFMPNDDRNGPALPLMFAVNMLVNTEEGDTYTFSEMSAWLRDIGYINPRLLEVPGPSPLVLANKPGP